MNKLLGIYLTAGYPSLDSTLQQLKILDEEGVDLIELGIPCADALADGPVIQNASYQSVKNGTNLDLIFSALKNLFAEYQAKSTTKGLSNMILFSYYNPLYVYGIDKVIEKASQLGLKGALIPDLPLEEAEEWAAKFQAANLHLVLLAAITSSPERLQKIYNLSSPFIYLVSRIGITGTDQDIAKLKATNSDENNLALETLKHLKSLGDKPIALGFGIDSAEKIAKAHSLGADIAVVGTQAIKKIEEDSSLNVFRSWLSSLRI